MSKYENIETVIDRFLDYVKTNNQVSLSNVASALAISSSQAERLATLLEQSGFIEIHYGIRDVMVSSKKTEETASKIQKETQVGKSKAIEQSKEIEHEVLTAENLLKFFERDIGRRIEIAGQLLKDIEDNNELSPADVEKVEMEVDLALGQLAAFSSEVKTLSDIEENFYQRLTEFKTKLHSLKHSESAKKELSLLAQIIQWIKSLFARAKQKPRRVTRKKKAFERQVGVTFIGNGGFQLVKKRVFKQRSDRISQHYWKKRKARKSITNEQ